MIAPMTFILAHEIQTGARADEASSARTMLLLHGIFGSGRNWRSFVRRFVERRPEWRVVAVDLRLHGESTGAPPPHTIAACAADLHALAARVGAPDVVCGHSFGGKVALQFGADHGEGLDAVWVLDSPPGAAATQGTPMTESEAARALAAMRATADGAASRSECIQALVEEGVAPPIATWLATNLVRGDDAVYRWSFDLDGLAELLDDYWRVDGYALIDRIAPPVHGVRAANSDRWSDAELARIDALAARGAITAHLLADAAHWLHVDNPDGLLDLLAGAL